MIQIRRVFPSTLWAI